MDLARLHFFFHSPPGYTRGQTSTSGEDSQALLTPPQKASNTQIRQSRARCGVLALFKPQSKPVQAAVVPLVCCTVASFMIHGTSTSRHQNQPEPEPNRNPAIRCTCAHVIMNCCATIAAAAAHVSVLTESHAETFRAHKASNPGATKLTFPRRETPQTNTRPLTPSSQFPGPAHSGSQPQLAQATVPPTDRPHTPFFPPSHPRVGLPLLRLGTAIACSVSARYFAA